MYTSTILEVEEDICRSFELALGEIRREKYQSFPEVVCMPQRSVHTSDLGKALVKTILPTGGYYNIRCRSQISLSENIRILNTDTGQTNMYIIIPPIYEFIRIQSTKCKFQFKVKTYVTYEGRADARLEWLLPVDAHFKFS